jgi:hypothetical protein
MEHCPRGVSGGGATGVKEAFRGQPDVHHIKDSSYGFNVGSQKDIPFANWFNTVDIAGQQFNVFSGIG